MKTAKHVLGVLGQVLLNAGSEREMGSAPLDAENLEIFVLTRLAKDRGKGLEHLAVQNIALGTIQEDAPIGASFQGLARDRAFLCHVQTSARGAYTACRRGCRGIQGELGRATIRASPTPAAWVWQG